LARVIHTAQALVDVVVEVASLPRRGGNAVASSYARYAGGAVNVLVAAARSGARTVHAGAHGTGPNGDLVRAALAAEGVAVTGPEVPGLDTGICFVMVEPSAERTFVTTQGAERHISVASLRTSAPAPGDLVCVSGYSLAGLTRDPLLEWLDGLAPGVEVVLDPGAALADLDRAVCERMLAGTTVWTSNAEEAYALAHEADLAASARRANAAGAIKVTRRGPATAPTAAEIDAFLAGHVATAPDCS
jgi:sugar/nucleoside kinase (ribokinase family)